jgi:hypothetical protein
MHPPNHRRHILDLIMHATMLQMMWHGLASPHEIKFQSKTIYCWKSLASTFWQAMAWFQNFIPLVEKFHVVILASVVWAIWNNHKRVTFDKYILKSLSVISSFSIFCWFIGQVSRKMQLTRTNYLRVAKR